MNFRDLKYVVETADCLSFSKASERCHVSQPSLSIQIRKVESIMGTAIFTRAKRRIYLTPFGEVFVAKAKAILAIKDTMHEEASLSQNTLQGTLRLGAILTVAPYLFPQVVQSVRDKAPNMTLALKEAKTEELMALLLSGGIDAALLSLPTDDHAFFSQPLVTEPFFVAVPEHHALAAKSSVRPSDLDACDLVLLEEGHCFRDQALSVCQRSRARENQTFSATSLETIRYFVAASDSVTLMPAMAQKPGDGMRYLPLVGEKFSRTIGMVWPKSSSKKRHIEKLTSLIRDDCTFVSIT